MTARSAVAATLCAALGLTLLGPRHGHAQCVPPIIDPTAFVAADATLGCGVTVGAHSRIRSGSSVGDNTQIGTAVKFGPDASIGTDGVVGDRTTVQTGASIGDHARIGSRVRIRRGVVIHDNAVIEDGADVRTGSRLMSNVAVGASVTIRAYTVVSAGTAVPAGETIPSRDGSGNVPPDEPPACDTARDCYDFGSLIAVQCADQKDIDVQDGLECAEGRSDPGLRMCLRDPDCPVGLCDFGLCNDPPCESSSDCDDGNECTFNFCDGEGKCAFPPIFAAPCDDGQRVCDADGRCVDPCLGNSQCDDGEVCTHDFCSVFGFCSFSDRPDGTPCSVGSEPGECASGECLPPPPCELDRECDDGNECTIDTCDLATGKCVYSPESATKVCGAGGCVDGVSSPIGNCDGAGGCDNGAQNCSALWQPCKDYFCNAQTGLCDFTNRFNGLLCGGQHCEGDLLVGPGCVDGECVEGAAQTDCKNVHRPDEPGRCCDTLFSSSVACVPCE